MKIFSKLAFFVSLVCQFAGITPAVAGSPVAAGAEAPAATGAERFSGLYQGAILYKEGASELEATIELGVDAEGRLGGTIDMPPFGMLYHPLETIRVDGDEIYLAYRRFSEARGPDALFEFEGRLTDDGTALVGEFIEHRGRIPFRFERLGEVGSPRPELERRPLRDLAPAGDELREGFNRHPDRVRLVMLLSPT